LPGLLMLFAAKTGALSMTALKMAGTITRVLMRRLLSFPRKPSDGLTTEIWGLAVNSAISP
jgi:hypothetical protein